MDVSGKVVLVTGGGGGIGAGIAEAFAEKGAKVAVTDINLEYAKTEAYRIGHDILPLRHDVTSPESWDSVKQAVEAALGPVDVLCNNAGVAPGGLAWESTVADWQWCLGVNVYGVIHGLRSFVPLMLAQDDEAHIVNTASVAGLLSPPGMGIYCVSKHAVVTLTECLHHDLAGRSDKVRASVLCPAYVPTGIHDSERNRPEELRNAPQQKSEDDLAREAALRHAVQSGRISAEQVADTVFEAVRDERFYILTHQKIKGAIETRMMDILLERPPTDTSRPRK